MCQHDALLKQVEEAKKCSEENHRTLRGHNGEVGLVGKVDRLETNLSHLTTNDLPHMEERIMTAIKTQAEKNVTWPGLARGLVGPVVVAVVTAVAVAAMMNWIF